MLGGTAFRGWRQISADLDLRLAAPLHIVTAQTVILCPGLQMLGIKGGGLEGRRRLLLAPLQTCSTHSGALTAGPNVMVLTPLFHVRNLDSSTAGPAPKEQDSREELQLRWNKE